ncbi:hypothetical protein KU43P_13370 [Pseudomonas sp. KU43P]|nr:hypothetical protein KU43P_13370 [Pseudomonas sp. KU43P]
MAQRRSLAEVAGLVEGDEKLELLDVHEEAWGWLWQTLTKSAIDVIDRPVRHIDWTPWRSASSVAA